MPSKTILPPTYVLIAIVIMVVLHLLFPVTVIISLPWNVIGLLPLLLGIGINLMADNALRKAKTTVKPFEESSALVTSGVYRISPASHVPGIRADSHWRCRHHGITHAISGHPSFCHPDRHGIHPSRGANA